MNEPTIIFGLSIIQLLPFVAGLTIVSIVLMIWFSLIEKDPLAARAKAVREHKRLVQTTQRTEETDRRVSLLRKNRLSDLAARWRNARGERATQIRNQLAQAGFRTSEAVGVYILAKFLGPFLAISFSFLYYFSSAELQDQQMFIRAFYFIACGMAGIALPDAVLDRLGQRRQRKIQGSLPDALDLLIICTEAGLSLDAAFDRVSMEMAATHQEISDELSLTSVEMTILPQRSEALINLTKRTNVPAIESVVSTLNQTEKYGTPLAQSFRILSADFREARLLRAEEKAAKLPATLTVPMVGFIFPCLFIVLLGPAYIQTMERI